MTIAFDVDDTLIIPSVVTRGRNQPHYNTIKVYKWFQEQGHDMIVWSGSGVEWAQTWVEILGLAPCRVIIKGAEKVDIAFDDCIIDLGTVNVRVKRIKNNISREEWNKTKYEKRNNNGESSDQAVA